MMLIEKISWKAEAGFLSALIDASAVQQVGNQLLVQRLAYSETEIRRTELVVLYSRMVQTEQFA